MSRIPDVQAAVRALAGVERASVSWPEPHGPATLNVVLEAGADREQVTARVLETLREVGGVDLATLRVEMPPAPQVPPPPPPAPAAPMPEPEAPAGVRSRRRSRIAFSGLRIERDELENSVTVTLRRDDQTFTGRAQGLATWRATPRTAAAAALLALRELLPADTRVHLDWLEVSDGAAAGRPSIVQSAVTCLAPSGEHTYIGAAIVRDDLREAAVRATLDALNRRLEQTAAA